MRDGSEGRGRWDETIRQKHIGQEDRGLMIERGRERERQREVGLKVGRGVVSQQGSPCLSDCLFY